MVDLFLLLILLIPTIAIIYNEWCWIYRDYRRGTQKTLDKRK